jgi:hypothetical protein
LLLQTPTKLKRMPSSDAISLAEPVLETPAGGRRKRITASA